MATQDSEPEVEDVVEPDDADPAEVRKRDRCSRAEEEAGNVEREEKHTGF